MQFYSNVGVIVALVRSMEYESFSEEVFEAVANLIRNTLGGEAFDLFIETGTKDLDGTKVVYLLDQGEATRLISAMLTAAMIE